MTYHCPVCREELLDRAVRATCSFCGREEETDWVCPGDHHAYEECRIAPPDELIDRVAQTTRETNPAAIAERMMVHPSFLPGGPEHHGVPAAALLAALRNAGLVVRPSPRPPDSAKSPRQKSMAQHSDGVFGNDSATSPAPATLDSGNIVIPGPTEISGTTGPDHLRLAPTRPGCT